MAENPGSSSHRNIKMIRLQVERNNGKEKIMSQDRPSPI